MTFLPLSAVEAFKRNGWVITDLLDGHVSRELARWVSDIATWENDGPWLQYHEMTELGPKICRTENFTPYHSGLDQLLRFGPLIAAASDLLGEPAVLYKEKINYKLAGGAGFAPHQDAPAYRFVNVHISCMIAVDPATVENGCLEIASAKHDRIYPMNDAGCIQEAIADTFDWMPVQLSPGQVLWFDSRTPHRSGPNNSNDDRRALFPTYNALREGDLRARYYDQKAEEFRQMRDSGTTVRVSLIGDFQGRPV